MKLTPQLIATAPRVVNPEGKLTLILRNSHLSFIENLEFTNDIFSVLDLTNNDILEVGGVGRLPSLETLLLGNNNISSVAPVEDSELKSLSLANNNIRTTFDAANLRHFAGLEDLLMMGNPVAESPVYRLFVVWLLPRLRVLDLRKVTPKERAEARDLYGESYEQRSPAAEALLHGTTKAAAEPKEVRLMRTSVKRLTAEEKEALLKELESATTMDEVERISALLKSG